jgi:hypothetical protein
MNKRLLIVVRLRKMVLDRMFQGGGCVPGSGKGWPWRSAR